MVVEIEGVPLHLAHPDELSITWVGQEEVMRQLLAAWLVIDAQDLPMNPRLLGKPGVGKTTLAYAAAKRVGQEAYIMQATVDTRPEDLPPHVKDARFRDRDHELILGIERDLREVERLCTEIVQIRVEADLGWVNFQALRDDAGEAFEDFFL